MPKVERLVTGLLVVIFCMAAVVKLTDKFDIKAHLFMKKEFTRFAKVSPFTLLFKYQIDPYKYMKAFGIAEGLVGILLIIGTKYVKILSSIVGIGIMALAIHMLFMLGDPPFTMIPASISIGCLILNIYFVATKSEEEPVKTTKTE